MPRTPKGDWATLFDFAGGGLIHIELFAALVTAMPGSSFLELIAEKILLRGTHANRPGVDEVPIASEYWATDTGARWKSDGTSWLADGTSLAADATVIRTTTLTLTDAQIKSAPTTHYQILPAPGANKLIVPIIAVATLDATAANYTNVDAGGATLQIEMGAGRSALYEDISQAYPLLADGQSEKTRAVLTFGDAKGAIGALAAAIENDALELTWLNGASGNFTGGNAANNFRVTVVYTTIDLV